MRKSPESLLAQDIDREEENIEEGSVQKINVTVELSDVSDWPERHDELRFQIKLIQQRLSFHEH